MGIDTISNQELRTEDIKLKEKLLQKEIPAILPREIAAVLQSPLFQKELFLSSELLVNNSRGEAGFRVVRSMTDGKHYFSEVKSNTNASLDLEKLPFPDFPDKDKAQIQTNLESEIPQPLDADDDSTWKSLDILSLHFHPLQKSDNDPSWFNASPFDLKSLYGRSAKNSLKLRVLSGLSANILRAINKDNSQPDYIQKIQAQYDYFMFGFFAKEKRQPGEKNSFEADYRPYTSICMRLSEHKIQLLLLHDDPELPVINKFAPAPIIFTAPTQDLETNPTACQSIIDYYQQLGFRAGIVFFTKNPDTNDIKINNFF